jgi:hypothetical protein
MLALPGRSRAGEGMNDYLFKRARFVRVYLVATVFTGLLVAVATILQVVL